MPWDGNAIWVGVLSGTQFHGDVTRARKVTGSHLDDTQRRGKDRESVKPEPKKPRILHQEAWVLVKTLCPTILMREGQFDTGDMHQGEYRCVVAEAVLAMVVRCHGAVGAGNALFCG